MTLLTSILPLQAHPSRLSTTIGTLSACLIFIVVSFSGTAQTNPCANSILSVAVQLTHPTCAGSNDGEIISTATNGPSPYQYQWNAAGNFATSSTIDLLTAGDYIVTVTDAAGCTATDTITLIDPPAINVVLDSVGTPCNTSMGEVSVDVTGGAQPYLFAWNNGESTDTIQNLPVGLYSVTITDATGCTEIVDANVVEPNGPVVTVAGVNVTCPDSTNGEASVTNVVGLSPFVYAWNDPAGQTTTTASGLGQGSFNVTVTDAGACSTVETVTLTPTATNPTVNLGPDLEICGGEATTLSAGVHPQYQWNTGETTPNIVVNNSGNYSVVVTSAEGCTGTDSVNVSVADGTILGGIAFGPVCEGDTAQQLVPGLTDYVFSGPGITDPQTGEFDPGRAGQGVHAIFYESQGDCFDTATVYVSVYATPHVFAGLPFTIDYGLEYTLTAYGTANSWIWNDSIQSEQMTITEPGTYTLQGINETGCSATDSVTLDVICEPRVWAPSAFTPDGDGINDEFRVFADNLQKFELTIWSRMGELIFQTKDQDIGWDGRIDSKLAPLGVYVYRIDYKQCPNFPGNNNTGAIFGNVTVLH